MNYIAVVFFFAAILALAVMQQTEHDEINSRDLWWVQLLRRFGFLMMASSLGNAIYHEADRVSLILVILSGIYSLVINYIALSLRKSPPNKNSTLSHDNVIERYVNLIREDLLRLDQGQLLTHEYLQDIRNHLKMETDKATVEPNVIFPPRWKNK